MSPTDPKPPPVADNGALSDDTEYVGDFPSVEDMLRSMFEPEISSGCAWLLEYVDWSAVLAKFEADGCRYIHELGRVYRIGE